MVAPLSLIVSAFAPVRDVRRTLTPQLRTDRGETSLLLIDLGGGRNRLGGSCLAQVYGSSVAKRRTATIRARSRASSRRSSSCAPRVWSLAYHDRSDGGLFATLAEMAFAGRCGVELDLGCGCRLGRGGAVQRRAGRGAADSRERCASRARKCSSVTVSLRFTRVDRYA